MVLRPGELPPSYELTAHVDTALDASARWIARGLRARPADRDGWDNATYYSRILLMRGADCFAQLGYVLQRESLEGQAPTSREGVAQALAYWQEASLDLDTAGTLAKKVAGTGPDDLAARRTLAQMRELVLTGGDWVEQMGEALAQARGPERLPPGAALRLVPEQRPDDGLERGLG